MARAPTFTDAPTPVSRQRMRSDKVWQGRGAWQGMYEEAYALVLPNRRPGGTGAAKPPTLQIFDMTGPNSAINCANEIQRQIFPAATPFTLEPGPLLVTRMNAAERTQAEAAFGAIAAFTYPFFKTGDFDTATHEACTDLTIGTGAVLPLKGPSIEEPLKFVCVPQDELAVGQDAWSVIDYVSWKRQVGRQAILDAWPKGNFSAEFRQDTAVHPYDEVTVWQDFFRLPNRKWRWCAYLDQAETFIATGDTETQPIAVARFYRWPGEAYGRGPVLFALPTIKTANKAQELTLKAFAIQMLGIWGYRSGGTFNPNTVRVGPGEFWPMQSTGGVLGPDAMRLDPAAGRVDLARLVIPQLQAQIRSALLDTRLTDDGGTPASASEIATLNAQNAKVHIGAYGRLNREMIVPVVTRGLEILHEWRLLPELMNFNELLTTIWINSPMAQALKADELAAAVNYWQLVAATVGPERVPQKINEERYLRRARGAMLVPPDIVTTADEEQAAVQALAASQAQATLAEGAVKAAPQLVQAAAAPPDREAA